MRARHWLSLSIVAACVAARTQAAEESTASAPGNASRWLVGAGAGPAVPFVFLMPGYEIAIEAQRALPEIDDRLRLSVSLGLQQLTGKAARILPQQPFIGPGLDSGFIENVLSFPLELGAFFALWRGESQGIWIGAAYAPGLTSATFFTFGQPVIVRVPSHTAVGQLRYLLRIGPGEASASLRASYGYAPLGALGDVGTSSLSAVSLRISYSISLGP